MILEGRQLTIGYPDRIVGAGLDVQLAKSEVLALLGPNGGGKTTLLAATMLDRLGIAELAERPYTMISGGERQLVLLARALAQEPQFIVLDEPTANLDFGNQGKVMRDIRALAASGLGVLFTTHDPNHALRAADRAYLLRGGERIAEGPVHQILTRERLEALYGAPVHMITDPTGTAFIPG
jgi:iron complex transport system ATP-binding protein